MYDDLKGKTVVVTGSSKGLGAAMARRFGAEGMNVVANYRSDEEGARETVRAIEDAGGAAAAVQADVSKGECVDALFDAAMFSFGGVDIWVNNAGIEVASPSDRKSIEEWQRVIDVNLTGVFAGCRRAIDHFLDRKMPGVIINLSSVHEIIPWPHFADYAASKAGVGMLTKTLALEYADRGIRVNAVLPGSTDTGMKQEFEKMAGGKEALLRENGTAGRLASPAEMAEPLLFLNSPMARFVSGQLLIVDMANNCQIVLGYKKSRLNVPVALKLYNTKFFQKQLQKQI